MLELYLNHKAQTMEIRVANVTGGSDSEKKGNQVILPQGQVMRQTQKRHRGMVGSRGGSKQGLGAKSSEMQECPQDRWLTGMEVERM